MARLQVRGAGALRRDSLAADLVAAPAFLERHAVQVTTHLLTVAEHGESGPPRGVEPGALRRVWNGTTTSPPSGQEAKVKLSPPSIRPLWPLSLRTASSAIASPSSEVHVRDALHSCRERTGGQIRDHVVRAALHEQGIAATASAQNQTHPTIIPVDPYFGSTGQSMTTEFAARRQSAATLLCMAVKERRPIHLRGVARPATMDGLLSSLLVPSKRCNAVDIIGATRLEAACQVVETVCTRLCMQTQPQQGSGTIVSDQPWPIQGSDTFLTFDDVAWPLPHVLGPQRPARRLGTTARHALQDGQLPFSHLPARGGSCDALLRDATTNLLLRVAPNCSLSCVTPTGMPPLMRDTEGPKRCSSPLSAQARGFVNEFFLEGTGVPSQSSPQSWHVVGTHEVAARLLTVDAPSPVAFILDTERAGWAAVPLRQSITIVPSALRGHLSARRRPLQAVLRSGLSTETVLAADIQLFRRSTKLCKLPLPPCLVRCELNGRAAKGTKPSDVFVVDQLTIGRLQRRPAARHHELWSYDSVAMRLTPSGQGEGVHTSVAWNQQRSQPILDSIVADAIVSSATMARTQLTIPNHSDACLQSTSGLANLPPPPRAATERVVPPPTSAGSDHASPRPQASAPKSRWAALTSAFTYLLQCLCDVTRRELTADMSDASTVWRMCHDIRAIPLTQVLEWFVASSLPHPHRRDISGNKRARDGAVLPSSMDISATAAICALVHAFSETLVLSRSLTDVEAVARGRTVLTAAAAAPELKPAHTIIAECLRLLDTHSPDRGCMEAPAVSSPVPAPRPPVAPASKQDLETQVTQQVDAAESVSDSPASSLSVRSEGSTTPPPAPAYSGAILIGERAMQRVQLLRKLEHDFGLAFIERDLPEPCDMLVDPGTAICICEVHVDSSGTWTSAATEEEARAFIRRVSALSLTMTRVHVLAIVEATTTTGNDIVALMETSMLALPVPIMLHDVTDTTVLPALIAGIHSKSTLWKMHDALELRALLLDESEWPLEPWLVRAGLMNPYCAFVLLRGVGGGLAGLVQATPEERAQLYHQLAVPAPTCRMLNALLFTPHTTTP